MTIPIAAAMLEKVTATTRAMMMNQPAACSSVLDNVMMVTKNKQPTGIKPIGIYCRNAVLASLLRCLIVVIKRQMIIDSPIVIMRNIGLVNNVFGLPTLKATEASKEEIKRKMYS